jgi:membrane-associated protein
MLELLHQLADLFLHLDRHLSSVLDAYGGWTYLLLFLIVFCETGLVVTPFLPGDSLLFAAGVFAAKGSLSLSVLLPLLSVAAIVGDSVNYAVGQFVGPRLLAMKRFRPVKPEHLALTEDFFRRYGGRTIVLARFVPIVRTLAPFVAGLGSMKYAQFMAYNMAGGIGWVVACTLAGYIFGGLPFVRDHFSLVVLAIIALSVMPSIWEVVRARRLRRGSNNHVPDVNRTAGEHQGEPASDRPLRG